MTRLECFGEHADWLEYEWRWPREDEQGVRTPDPSLVARPYYTTRIQSIWRNRRAGFEIAGLSVRGHEVSDVGLLVANHWFEHATGLAGRDWLERNFPKGDVDVRQFFLHELLQFADPLPLLRDSPRREGVGVQVIGPQQERRGGILDSARKAPERARTRWRYQE